MIINNEVFESYLNCKYKAYLKLGGNSSKRSEYEIIQNEIKTLYKRNALKNVLSVYKENVILGNPDSISAFESGKEVIINAHINYDGLELYCDFMEKNSGKSDLGPFHYVPVIFVEKEKISKEDRLMMAYNGLVIGNMQDRYPEYGKIVYGEQFKRSKIKFNGELDVVRKIISDLKQYCDNATTPRIVLNHHCQICEFKDLCRIKAIEKDDLSLLCGISTKEIEAQNNKGIFTVTQYSYTFRPRRRFRKSYPFNLKALAIREKKIHIYGTTEIPTADVQVYLDVEGDLERSFYYLIGLIIVQDGIEKRYSFWADNQSQEKDIFCQFLSIIKNYQEFKLYHYGSYERKFLQKMQKDITQENIQVFNKLVENSVNILSIIYSHIFFPTYSNGLKDIGTYLGFRWSDENLSGIQSLVWRKRFEITNDEAIKSKLVKYNLEDCLALQSVTGVIKKISLNFVGETNSNRGVVYTDDLKNEARYKWGNVEFVLEDLEYINNCAYFNYQREKVFIRTNKNMKNVKRHGRFQEKLTYKINKRIINPIHRECPYCKGKLYRNGSNCIKTIYDLKFSDSGIKRWITTYEATRVRCVPCRKVITFESLQEIPKYGHDLISWVMYQNIAGHQPFNRIQYMLNDFFGLSVSGITLQRFKNIAAEYYQETYQGIIQKIKRGNLIHVDETQVAFQEVSGYVWVFTNMEEVYFLYTPTREGDFLKELLSGFRGILISDFYGAYCSPEWLQQKCLIHLIRDLNDDLRNNPSDEEYKKMVTDFLLLLRQIITTVDKYGLKKRNLSKHKKDVLIYFRNILGYNYRSELALKYQKRFKKNEKNLFTFLDYDGIPWNNNNAEHAIKHFAIFRRIMKQGGGFTQKGLNDYLVLLSIYQTCRYKGINFLKFLVSKEKDIDKYHNGCRRKVIKNDEKGG